MMAVMKKFQGSSVPKPRMKKISQTPKYLQEDFQNDFNLFYVKLTGTL